MLGNARKILITKDDTAIVDGAGEKSEMEGRVTQIRSQIEDTTSDTTRKSCRSGWRSSPAALRSSGSAAASETEVKERKDLDDDALHATRAPKCRRASW